MDDRVGLPFARPNSAILQSGCWTWGYTSSRAGSSCTRAVAVIFFGSKRGAGYASCYCIQCQLYLLVAFYGRRGGYSLGCPRLVRAFLTLEPPLLSFISKLTRQAVIHAWPEKPNEQENVKTLQRTRCFAWPCRPSMAKINIGMTCCRVSCAMQLVIENETLG